MCQIIIERHKHPGKIKCSQLPFLINRWKKWKMFYSDGRWQLNLGLNVYYCATPHNTGMKNQCFRHFKQKCFTSLNVWLNNTFSYMYRVKTPIVWHFFSILFHTGTFMFWTYGEGENTFLLWASLCKKMCRLSDGTLALCFDRNVDQAFKIHIWPEFNKCWSCIMSWKLL